MEEIKENKAAKRTVSERLGNLHLLEPNYIKVEVINGTLILHGYVQSWTDRDNIEDAIKGVRGIKSILNNLEIRSIPPVDI